jgi:hypothetical protein
MQSRGLANLTTEELQYLEKLISTEFAKECEYAKTFDTKNGWHSNVKGQRLLRIINAIRDQQKAVKIKAEKW